MSRSRRSKPPPQIRAELRGGPFAGHVQYLTSGLLEIIYLERTNGDGRTERCRYRPTPGGRRVPGENALAYVYEFVDCAQLDPNQAPAPDA